MIRIEFRKTSETGCFLKIKGHDYEAEKGSNLVCCAVSVLAQNFVVGIEQVLMAKVSGKIEYGLCDIKVEVTDGNKDYLDKVFKIFEIGFQKVQEAYPKQVEMNK